MTLRDASHLDLRISIAAACFSIYAYQELKAQLEACEELRFIFTSPTFVAEKMPKERREFYIPRLKREKSLYGTEFEVRLRNELSFDYGFRVFRVDSSNMKDVYYRPNEFQHGQLSLLADNIKEDRQPEDLLFQVMLDLGVLLSSKIEETTIYHTALPDGGCRQRGERVCGSALQRPLYLPPGRGD